ncbi:ABC transporter ATP-binding protein [Sporolactobacillus shoreicorticis]|uniref:ABC transporter ATP-binding protein n=1 Tax=Sporolactobacillus shoreicorticis TaxID=1923877 RepID=A0ABW5S301_9BACL|nr:ABC transporter ATP-binding protein [Sporolactobacillus shoreicorticis]MCO7125283.1 ABC transporter ATP-binding protein [Sporolactobacillus shoreicorticis]
MNEHLLTATNINRIFVSKQRSFTALDNINLTIGNHEFVSLLGPSGCGKSTFLRLVAGLDSASSGSLQMNGNNLDKPGRDRGVVFQQYSLLPWLLAWQNVAFALKKEKNMRAAEKKELAYHFLDLVGLNGFEEIYPSQMSGGMQQRVAIARALVIKPPLLLMDEPFGALDAQTRRDMQDLLVTIFKETRSSVLFVTHDVDEAVYLSDRVYVMATNPGRIAKQIDIHLSADKDWSIQLSEPFITYKKEILMELKKQKKNVHHSK